MSYQRGIVEIVPGRTARGEGMFCVIVKRSYRIHSDGTSRRCEKDKPLRLIDHYYENGDPQWSTVEFENEVAPFKAASDVVIIGKAYASKGRPTQEMAVGVKIGTHKKILRIVGDRQCHWRPDASPSFSEPELFLEMEIRYERAYGGRDEISDPNLPFYYPRNDLGKGVALYNLKNVIQNLALPNIEDPEDLLTPDRVVIEDPYHWPLMPMPQGFGWLQRTWYPRSALIGACPAFIDPGTVTKEEAMKLLPANHVALARQMRLPPFEAQFNNGASIGMTFTALKDDETIGLRGLTRDGTLDFRLPGETPKIALDVGKGAQPLDTKIHTVSIRPDDLELDIVWRGALHFGPYAKLSTIRCLEAHVQ